MTRSQHEALAWLKAQGGSGVFTRRKDKPPQNLYFLAGGEWSLFMPSTWHALAGLGRVSITGNRVCVLSTD